MGKRRDAFLTFPDTIAGVKNYIWTSAIPSNLLQDGATYVVDGVDYDPMETSSGKPYVVMWTEADGFIDLAGADVAPSTPELINNIGTLADFSLYYQEGDPTTIDKSFVATGSFEARTYMVRVDGVIRIDYKPAPLANVSVDISFREEDDTYIFGNNFDVGTPTVEISGDYMYYPFYLVDSRTYTAGPKTLRFVTMDTAGLEIRICNVTVSYTYIG